MYFFTSEIREPADFPERANEQMMRDDRSQVDNSECECASPEDLVVWDFEGAELDRHFIRENTVWRNTSD